MFVLVVLQAFICVLNLGGGGGHVLIDGGLNLPHLWVRARAVLRADGISVVGWAPFFSLRTLSPAASCIPILPPGLNMCGTFQNRASPTNKRSSSTYIYIYRNHTPVLGNPLCEALARQGLLGWGSLRQHADRLLELDSWNPDRPIHGRPCSTQGRACGIRPALCGLGFGAVPK